MATAKSDSAKSLFWKVVIEKLCLQSDFNLNQEEMKSLMLLKFGLTWLDMISQEWIDIYGAIYDDADMLVYNEKQLRRIERDIHRTFGVFAKSHIGLYSLHKSLEENCSSLQKLLNIMSYQLSYTQGMNYIAALVILMEDSSRNCFILVSFLLLRRHLYVLYDHKSSSLSEYINVFDRKLRNHNRVIYKHFKRTGFISVCYALEWFTTSFIVSNPGEFSLRVMDLLFAGIPNILLRVGLAIVDSLNDKILTLELEDLQLNFRNILKELNVEDTILRALKIQLDDVDILETMSKNIEQMNPQAELINTFRYQIDGGSEHVVEESSKKVSVSQQDGIDGYDCDNEDNEAIKINMQVGLSRTSPTDEVEAIISTESKNISDIESQEKKDSNNIPKKTSWLSYFSLK